MIEVKKGCMVCSHVDLYPKTQKCHDCGNTSRFVTSFRLGKQVTRCVNCKSLNVTEEVDKCRKCKSENLQVLIGDIGIQMPVNWTRHKSESEISEVLVPDDRGIFKSPW